MKQVRVYSLTRCCIKILQQHAHARTRVQYVHTSFTRLLTSVEKMAISLHPPTEAIFSSAEARDRPSGENDSESTLCECF